MLIPDLKGIRSDSEKMSIEGKRNASHDLSLRIYILVERLKSSEMHRDVFGVKTKK